MVYVDLRVLLECLEKFLFGRALIMTGPKVGLKVIGLLIIEETLFVDDGVHGNEGVLEFVSGE
jgi:hypothetical protein